MGQRLILIKGALAKGDGVGMDGISAVGQYFGLRTAHQFLFAVCIDVIENAVIAEVAYAVKGGRSDKFGDGGTVIEVKGDGLCRCGDDDRADIGGCKGIGGKTRQIVGNGDGLQAGTALKGAAPVRGTCIVVVILLQCLDILDIAAKVNFA